MNFSPQTISIPEGIYNNIVRYITILTNNPAMIYKGSCSDTFNSGVYLLLNEISIHIDTDKNGMMLVMNNIDRRYLINNNQMLKLLTLIQDANKAIDKATSIHVKSIVEDVYEKVTQAGLFDSTVEGEFEE